MLVGVMKVSLTDISKHKLSVGLLLAKRKDRMKFYFVLLTVNIFFTGTKNFQKLISPLVFIFLSTKCWFCVVLKKFCHI